MRPSTLLSIRVPLGVLALGLLLTAAGAVWAYRDAHGVDHTHLRNSATRANAVIADGINEYENLLTSSSGMLSVSGIVSPGDWRQYVSALQLDRRYPGVRGVGYIAAVSAPDIDGFVQRTRDVIPDFALRRLPDPPPDVHDYFPIVYIEPIERNAPSRGLDIGSEAIRRAAAEQARDTGQPVLTHHIALVQDEQQRAGFLLLVPVYRRGMPTGSALERRAAHVGWVYAPLIADEFMGGLRTQLSSQITLHLAEAPAGSAAAADTILGAPAAGARDRVSTPLTLGGRDFVSTWTPSASFRYQPDYTRRVLTIGLLVTALLTLLVHRQQAAARRAAALTAEVAELFELAPAALLTIDGRGTILSANSMAERVFAAPPGSLLGRDVAELAALPAGAHARYLHQYITTGAASTSEGLVIGRTREVPARRLTGAEFPAELTVNEAGRGADGSRRFLGVVVDLTERQAAETRMVQAQKHEAAGRMVAGIAHDFNNLLAVITGGIGLARLDPQQQDRWLGNASTAADRAAALVRQLMQFTRPGARGDEPVSLGEVAQATIALVRETFDRRLLVESIVEPALPTVRGDRGQLQQAIMNLLINARDAVTERLAGDHTGAYIPSIRLDVQRVRNGAPGAPPQVSITVRDNGVGIAEADRQLVFDPFFTTKGPDRGTGLGLATTYAVVSEHGGTIEVTSEHGHGATFVIRLPASSSGAPTGTPPAPATDRARGARLGAVLVVDDEPLLGEIAAAVLEEAGYEVAVVTSGRAALDMCQARRFDVCLLDANMPRPDGWETLAQLHLLRPDLYVIMASGEQSAAHALARGANAFLQKPYSAAALSDAIAAAGAPVEA